MCRSKPKLIIFIAALFALSALFITKTRAATALVNDNVYISNFGNNTITVINTITEKVVATIATDNEPQEMVLSADGTTIYVSCWQSNCIDVVNTITNTVTENIPLGGRPGALILGPDGSRLYTVNHTSNAVDIITTSTNTLTSSINLPSSPNMIAVSPDESKLYVATESPGNITSPGHILIINTANNAISKQIDFSYGASELISSKDGGTLYFIGGNASLKAINTATYVQTPINVTAPINLLLSNDGAALYVSVANNEIAIVNTSTNQVTGTIVQSSYSDVAAESSDSNYLYIGETVPNSLGIANLTSNSIISTINLNSTPSGIIAIASRDLSATSASGTITACQGTASASPDIQSFTVSGDNLGANVSVTAPQYFEVSLDPTTGFGSSLNVIPSGGNVNEVKVYVRSSTSATAGAISGNVSLNSTGTAPVSVAVNGFINTLPAVDPVADQSVATGAATAAVNFTGTANTFIWTNDTPSIGLAASGAGNIASFTAQNLNTAPLKATITVTPVNADFAFITNKVNNVSVINTVTGQSALTITTGSQPYGVALSSDGTKAYITNTASNTITVIDEITNHVSSIPVGMGPKSIVISPDNKWLYILNSTSSISVVNTANNSVNNINIADVPSALAISPDGSKLYVAAGNSILTINTATNTVTYTDNVNVVVSALEVSPDGSTIYALINSNNSIMVISSGMILLNTIKNIMSPNSMCIAPDGSNLYVVDEIDSKVYDIDTKSASLKTTISLPVASNPFGIAINADGSKVYVVNNTGGPNHNGSLSVISTITNTVVNDIASGAGSLSVGNFIRSGTPCPGNPETFTITVGAESNITATVPAGIISSCQGTASISPHIAGFAVSATSLSAPVTVTGSAHYEVSLDANTGYAHIVSIPQSSGIVSNVQVYVRSSSAGSAGQFTEPILLSSPGSASISVNVSGTINALPAINAVSNENVNDGDAVPGINFSGTGNSFTWTNNTPSIGLAASGTGNIASFTAINSGTSPVTATITVTPANADHAYVTNSYNYVSAVDLLTGNNDLRLPTDSQPYGIAISHDGSKVFVSNAGAGNVTAINAVTNLIEGNISVGFGGSPHDMVISPDDKFVYVACTALNNVGVIDASGNNYLGGISTGGDQPSALIMSPDGSKLYVSAGSNILVVNTATRAVISTNNLGVNANYLAISPDGSKLYAAASSINSIMVINTATMARAGGITNINDPVSLCTSPDGATLYVVDEADTKVYVIDAQSASIKNTIALNSSISPFGIATNADGSKLYVVSNGGEPNNAGSVSVINTSANSVINTFPTFVGSFSSGNFIRSGTGCVGSPITFTITVKPHGLVPTITSTTPTGNIFTCQGTASVSPDIEQFSFSGKNLNGDITLSAPTDFEISSSSESGYNNKLIISQTNGIVSNTTIYVRAAANSVAGKTSGSIVLTSGGAVILNVAVDGTVNVIPTVNKVANQDVYNGNNTKAIKFTGTASAFDWTNDTPSIGLPANGIGDIASFTVINTGDTPITATITVTPKPTDPQCDGVSVSFTITAEPSVNTNSAQGLGIPNAFTPNGDGINDIWEIKALRAFPKCTVAVYDRWGQKLYSSIGYTIPWDGTSKGSGLPVGTYYYVIDLKNGVKAISGWVAIVR